MNSKSVSQIDVRATNYKNQFCTIKELKENEKINKCKHTFSSLKMGIFCENIFYYNCSSWKSRFIVVKFMWNCFRGFEIQFDRILTVVRRELLTLFKIRKLIFKQGRATFIGKQLPPYKTQNSVKTIFKPFSTVSRKFSHMDIRFSWQSIKINFDLTKNSNFFMNFSYLNGVWIHNWPIM